jgi:hypothetical protein
MVLPLFHHIMVLPLFHHVLDNSRRDSAKKNDDVRPVRKDWVRYFSMLVADYLAVVLPILLVFTVSAPTFYFDLLRCQCFCTKIVIKLHTEKEGIMLC